MSPEIKDNTINATTGAVERYFVKLFIFFIYINLILRNPKKSKRVNVIANPSIPI